MALKEEDFDYVSSSPLIGNKKTKEVIADERDMTTLERIQARLNEDIANLQSIRSLSARDPKFSVEQQLVTNSAIVLYLEGYKSIVDNGILGVKEALKEAQND